jgi:Tfp pilus assembly protein PilO
MKPLFLLAGVSVAICWLVGYNVVYAPQQEQVRLSRAEIAAEQANQEMQAEVSALLTQVERYRKRLPEEPDPSVLLRDVMALVQQSGVQLTSVMREAPQELSQFTLLRVNLQVDASYHQIGAFLDALERSDRFMRVERLKVTRIEPHEPASVNLVLSTLYVPPALPGFGQRTPER